MTAPRSPILTHRALDPSRKEFTWHESTIEGFSELLIRGFGIEFDLQVSKDGVFIVTHESSLSGLTEGEDIRSFRELEAHEIIGVRTQKGRLGLLEEVLHILQESKMFGALHVKHSIQTDSVIEDLGRKLGASMVPLESLLIFDLKITHARKLKSILPNCRLAPSVAHEYDVERYNSFVGGTLITVQDAIKYRDVYDWVWLDEWDRNGRNGASKTLYSKDTVAQLRDVGFNVALVSPELHATSPGLLGGESHQDASSALSLQRRLEEILDLKPDLICTDYPDQVQRILDERN